MKFLRHQHTGTSMTVAQVEDRRGFRDIIFPESGSYRDSILHGKIFLFPGTPQKK